MRVPWSAILALLVLVEGPGVAAAMMEPACASVTDAPAIEGGGFYAVGTQLWVEANRVMGLQRQPCAREDGVVVGADRFLLAAATAPPPDAEMLLP